MKHRARTLAEQTADKSTAWALPLVLLCAAGACEGLPEDELPRGVEATSQAVTMNSGSTTLVRKEGTSPGGRYPEVMLYNRNCTATIIAPYIALSADHCLHGSSVGWTWVNDNQTRSTEDLATTFQFVNPYSFSQRPGWWDDPNRVTPYHPFDQRIVRVPSLTPSEIANRGILLPDVDPLGALKHTEKAAVSGHKVKYMLVGTASGAPEIRDSAPTKLSTDGSGGLLRDAITPDFAQADLGDSGGPTYSSLFSEDGTYESRRVHIGTTKSPPASLPMAYDPGVAMTTIDREVARVNSLWIMARAADPDGDGIPVECDPSPITFNLHDGTCPALLGAPLSR